MSEERNVLLRFVPGPRTEPQPECGGALVLPTVWSGAHQNKNEPCDLVFEALGIATASAIANQRLALDDSGGQVLAGGVNLLVATYNGATISSALNTLLSPVSSELSARSETVAQVEQEHRHSALELAKTGYRLYRQSSVLPRPEYLDQLSRKVVEVEQLSRPLSLLQNPLPGHLSEAVGRSPMSRWLVTFDDFGFVGLLEKAGSLRGMLDIDLLTRSWHQQAFTGAYLEGVHTRPVPSPMVWTIITALPETVAKFLLSPNPRIAALAACCWMVNGDRAPNSSSEVSDWAEVVAKLAENPLRGVTHMSKEAIDALFCFQDKMEVALRQAPVEIVGFMTQLSRLVSKISLSLQARTALLAQNECPAQIMKAQVERAITRVELALPQRQELLQTWQQILAGRKFRKFCDVVLEKIIALGPIGTRDLCLSCNERLERVSQTLNHLLQADRILKRPDGRFDIPERWLSNLRVEVC